MKRFAVVALSCAAFPAVADAQTPTVQHVRQYMRAYRAVRRAEGVRAPGRNILRWRLANGKKPSDARLVESIRVLRRMLPHPGRVAPPSYQGGGGMWVSPPNSLVRCIISRESGGNAQAVNPNGHYGLGQWDISTWLAQGGGRYAPTPLGASYAEQELIIEQAVANGGASAWTPYDGCTP